MQGYAARLKHDIARWQQQGLIDASTAAALAADAEAGRRGVSFATVLSIMAAVLFCAALLLVVAANWEAIPRLVRAGLLFACMLAGYVGGAFLKRSGRDAFAEGAWLLAATAFGASIALIAQMYHLSGDEKEAIFVWGAGTALAAAALCSNPLTVGAVLLAGAWMLMHGASEWWSSVSGPPPAYLAIAGVLYLLSFWTRSAPARHLLILSLVLYALVDYGLRTDLATPLALAASGIALLAAMRLRPAETKSILGLGSGLEVHALIAFMAAVFVLQLEYEGDWQYGLVTVVAFAGIVAALLVAGRENAPLRWFAYAAFVGQTVMVYLVLVGSMLGTAGFFLVGGLALSILAFLISRVERRFSEQAVEGGAS